MVGGHRDAETLPEEVAPAEVRTPRVRRDDGDVQVAGGHQIIETACGALFQDESHMRRCRREAGDQSGDQGGAEGVQEPETDLALSRVREIVDCAARGIQLQLSATGVLVEDPAKWIQGEPLTVPVEELHAQAAFQTGQHAGECRLRKPELVGGRGDVL